MDKNTQTSNKDLVKVSLLTFIDLKYLVLLISITISILKSEAQCISYSMWGTGVAPLSGLTTTLSTCSYAGEYSTITSVSSSTSYISSSTGGSGNYITIRQGDGTGTIIAQGFSPLSWTSTTAGTYAQIINTNASCGTDATCHTLTITTNASSCTSTSLWGSGPAPASGNTTMLTSCAYGGEYSTITGVLAGSQYVSTATGGAGNYITIRKTDPTGTVIAQGFSPLNWSSTTSGTYVQIINTTSGCGTDATCHMQYVSSPCAPPPLVGFGTNSWNVIGYNNTTYNFTNLSTLSGQSYAGNYTDGTIDINSELRWTNSASPSSATGYTGCPITIDNHTVVYKRQGFPSSYYQIDLNNHDDGIQCYVNGNLVYQIDGCCTDRGIIWSGFLCASSTVEFRVMEGGGGSNLNVDFIESTDFSNIAGNDATLCHGQSTTLGGTLPNLTWSAANTSASGLDNTNFTASVTISGAPNGSTINSLSFTPVLSYASSNCLYYNSWYAMQYWNGTSWIDLACGNPVLLNDFNGSVANGFTLSLRAVDLDNYSDNVTININNLTVNLTTTPTYSWSPTSGLSNAAILNPIATPTAATNYTLSIGMNGCNLTDQVNVTLPNAGNALSSNNESATCQVNQNGWVHFYHSSGRLIASINSNGQNLGNVTATSYVDATNALVPACSNIENTSLMTSVMQRHWVITPTIQPTAPVSIKLPYSDVEYNELFNAASSNYNGYDDLANISDIKISKYNGPNINANALDNCTSGSTILINPTSFGSTNSYSSVNNGSYATGSINSFSEFWLHGSSLNSPLPSTFNYFTSECLGTNETILKWSTFTESNTNYFIIEKSENGKTWNKILIQEAAINSTNTLEYNGLDKTPNSEVDYYRLILVDLNGASDTLSTISSICKNVNEANSVLLYPNPNNGEFTINFPEEIISEIVTINVLDLKGNSTSNYTKKVTSGENSITIDESSLKSGIYFIEVKYNSKSDILKMIVL